MNAGRRCARLHSRMRAAAGSILWALIMKSVTVNARILAAGMMAASAALMAFAPSAAAQQAYPSKLIRFITPYPPGGATTPLAHFLGKKMTESWGQPVVVDNRPGAGTMIGVDAVAKAPPDGHTILLAGGGLVLVPLLFKAPYDPINDLAPVATFAKTELVLVINLEVPANDLKELIAYAKARPGQLNYGTPGAGGTQHLAHELLNLSADIKTQHIPYKGASPAYTDLIGGRVQMYIATTNTSYPHIKSGKVRPIAVSGHTRLPALPQVPTFAEAGLSGMDELGSWSGVIAPGGTPKAIVDKISTEIVKYMAMPDFKDMLVNQGMTAFYSNPEQFAALLLAEQARYGKIIKAVNIKVEN